MTLKTVHCRICGKAINGASFKERMAKIRSHRKEKHPTAHKRSVKKALKTKAKLDPLKPRKRLINKPRVIDHVDVKASGLIRVLYREDNTVFPEFALYPKALDVMCLKHAGLKEEARGKWVLRTNKFNIFVYI